MSIQIAEISQRLQSALDQNYNVSDTLRQYYLIHLLSGYILAPQKFQVFRIKC